MGREKVPAGGLVMVVRVCRHDYLRLRYLACSKNPALLAYPIVAATRGYFLQAISVCSVTSRG